VAIVFRASVPPSAVRAAVTAAIETAAPGVTVSYDTIGDYARALVRTDRVMTLLSAFFGLLALVVALVGIYGVMAYVVARRQAEIGIRIALGAGEGRVVRMLLKESGTLLAAGAACGVALAAVAARFAAQVLYGVDPLDAVSFATAVATLATTGLIAAWIPARRASRVAPAFAIRD
jgi:ABC-type antimicrobial peptide transport system permease subunit